MTFGKLSGCFVALMGAALCGVSPAPAQSDEPPIRRILVEAVSDSIARNPFWARLADMARDSVRVWRVPSVAVPGLVYHRAAFTPPRTSHVRPFTSIAVTRDGRSRLLNAAEDWAAVARWAPSDGRTAAKACAELVHALAFGRGDGKAVESMRSLDRLFSSEQLKVLRQHVRPPMAVTLDDGAWTAKVWYVLIGRTEERQCTFSAAGATVQVATSRSIPVGFFAWW
jgi:hypothetical protein